MALGLALVGGQKEVRVWDVASGAVQPVLAGHTDWVWSVAWSPDGSRVASASAGGDGTVRVWDVVSGVAQQVLEGHTGWVRSVAWSPDSTRVASAGDDGTVRVWDAVEGQETGRVVVGRKALSVDWSKATGALAVGTDRAVIVYKRVGR